MNNYTKLSDLVLEFVERLVQIGVSRDVADLELKGVEWAALQDLRQTNRDTQLLLNLERYGTAAMAERHNVAQRTIRDWRTDALNRQSSRRTAAG